MHGHILVWLDQQTARLFRIDRNGETTDAGPNQIVHHQWQSHAHSSDEKGFFSDIADGLAGAAGILITGPGEERSALSSWLTEKRPDIASNIWAVEAMDHPSDAQLVAHGRTYFSAEEKMRA